MSQIDWEHVYWELAPRLFNFFRYRTEDAETAKDLTARTFLQAWRYRHSYRHDMGAFEAWLFQIARNVFAAYRKEQRHQPLSLKDVQQLPSEFSLEHIIHERRESEYLYHLLLQLPSREQDVIALKFGAGLTNRAIARVMNLSESNIGTILHRTIQTLRTQWELTYERE
jgi:RNA polymerase sigma-70 factor (ECF subfamily)